MRAIVRSPCVVPALCAVPVSLASERKGIAEPEDIATTGDVWYVNITVYGHISFSAGRLH